MKAERISEIYKDCSALITERTQEIHPLVMGTGNLNADIMFIADAPKAEEEALGEPFSSKEGVQFEYMLEKMGLKKEDVYVTYLVKYHPYKVNAKSGRVVSRQPKVDEVKFFMDYLNEEINVISPKFIVTLGELPLRALEGNNRLKLSSEHGKIRKHYIGQHGYKLFPMYHPVSLKTEDDVKMEEDIEVLKKILDVAGDGFAKSEAVEKPAYEIAPKKNLMEPQSKPVIEKEMGKNSKFKAIIVYGAEGYADDPTLVVVDRVSKVLTELNTRIVRLDLYKEDVNIVHFFSELEDAQAIILATTVEWIGIGGKLQTFLDQCWRFGNKKYFENTYLFGIVISKQCYERDTYNYLLKSWELLGGLEGGSICARFENSVSLETDKAMLAAIDKKTEEFYRIAYKSRTVLPTSIRLNKIMVEVPTGQMDIRTEPALEQHDQTNSIPYIQDYDVFVEKQQKDIEDISNLLKSKLGHTITEAEPNEVEMFKKAFRNNDDSVNIRLTWNVLDKKNKNISLEIKGKKINAVFGSWPDVTLTISSSYKVLQKVLEGKMTIQRAFMTGEIKAKGDFTIIYRMDGLFKFI